MSHLPRVTSETFVIPLDDDRYIIYAPLRQSGFVANGVVVNTLADLKEGRFDVATDPEGDLVGFLRKLGIVDAGPEEAPTPSRNGAPNPTEVTLFLTTACNLRCTYCYAYAGDTPATFMSLEIAKRGIDFVSANAARSGTCAFEVAYHGGGEPTANWPVLTASFDHARERARELGLGVGTSCATNGVLADSKIDWITNHLDGVSVSFDGLPEAQDKNRRTASGSPSSPRVVRTLSRFDEARFPYGIRVTVTAEQITGLPDSIEFICSRFAPQRIQVEPAYQLGRGRGAPSAETHAFIDAFRAAQQRARAFDQTIRFSAARLGTLSSHFCGVTQDAFSLSPDGNVSACYEVFSEESPWADRFFYGGPDSAGYGYRFDVSVLDHLRDQSVQHRDHCRDCFAKWTCAGDCYHKALEADGGATFGGSERCHITRELTKDQILESIARSGGVAWREDSSGSSAGGASAREVR